MESEVIDRFINRMEGAFEISKNTGMSIAYVNLHIDAHIMSLRTRVWKDKEDQIITTISAFPEMTDAQISKKLEIAIKTVCRVSADFQKKREKEASDFFELFGR